MVTLPKRKAAAPTTAEERAAQAKREQREHEQKVALTERVRATRLRRANLDALTVSECEELAALHVKARASTDDGLARDDLEALTPKERKRFLELLDKATPEADREARRGVRAERERRALQAFTDEELNRGVPPERRIGLLAGEVVLPAVAFQTHALHVGDLGLLALILHAWSSGTPPFKDGRWSDDGEALLVAAKRLALVDDDLNRTWDGDGRPTGLVPLADTLEHLSRNGFLSVSRDDRGGWVIALGPHLLAAA